MINKLIDSIANLISFIGCCIINLFKCVKGVITGQMPLKNLIEQSATIGYDSIPIALVITFISGAVLALEVAHYFIMSGAEAYVGGLVAVAIVREMAPVFASLAIGARAGTAIAAEIGNMKVTEQIDAMKTLKVDPVCYLIAPRVLAGGLMVPLITVFAIIVGILGGMFISYILIDLHFYRYMNSVWLYLKIFDLKVALIKAGVFGTLVTLICSTNGYLTEGGAKEVGISTTKAAIYSTFAVLVFDYLLTWIFYS
jgi:phospholipid/cholesterol/gamma-HCH transport system permease protein